VIRRQIDFARSWQLARRQFGAVVAERDQLKPELADGLAEVRRDVAALKAIVQTERAHSCEMRPSSTHTNLVLRYEGTRWTLALHKSMSAKGQ
jgi:hypothetical protein